MIQRHFGTTLLTALTLTSTAAFAGEAKWYDDFDEAQKVALEEGKDLFVDFTGSDWCGWCIKLDEEVFEHEEWLDGAAEKFVLVKLDFPRGEDVKAKVPNPKRNEELQELFEVRGFPTILLLTGEGDLYGRMGYARGGPKPYLESMMDAHTEGHRVLGQAKTIETAFEAAGDDGAKWKVWENAMTLLESMSNGSALAGRMESIASWGFTADPKNEKGARLRSAGALLRHGLHSAEHLSFVEENDPLNVKGLLEIAVEADMQSVNSDETARAWIMKVTKVTGYGFQDKKLGFGLNFQAMNWAKGPLSDMELAKACAKACVAIGSDDSGRLAAAKALLGEDS